MSRFDLDRRSSGLAAAAAAFSLALVWLWVCLCTFPLRSWNDIRLAPAFAPKLGLSIYPGADGPASTWMYGPLPVWLNWPATLAPGPGEALLVAGVINILVTLLPTLAVAWLWPTAPLTSPGPAGRIVAASLAIAAMPWATWQYLQADNFAIGCGLVANLLFVRGRAEPARWAAAALATAALACKQTSLAIPLAQVVWVGLTVGRVAAAAHVGRLVVTGLAWLAVILLACEPGKLWYTALLTPAGLPWTDHPGQRFMQMLPHFIVHVVVPLAVWFGLRLGRPGGRTALALPLFAWLLAWPLGLSSVFKIGGTNNCLQGYPLFLPAGCVVAVAALAHRFGRSRAVAAVAAVGAAILVGRVATREIKVWRPHVEVYDDAVELCHRLPGRLWFPWNPLVTIYSEERLYPVEDGLYVKKVTGRPEPEAQTRSHLPSQFAAIVLAGTGSEWGLASAFLPPPVERVDFEHWTLTRRAKP
ncbi:hypothetical protein EBR04_08420 [bacterium]|nr:hypothetical protein [bacterium]